LATTGHFAYNSGYSVLKAVTGAFYSARAAANLTAGAVYLFKDAGQLGYYIAKDIPPLGYFWNTFSGLTVRTRIIAYFFPSRARVSATTSLTAFLHDLSGLKTCLIKMKIVLTGV